MAFREVTVVQTVGGVMRITMTVSGVAQTSANLANIGAELQGAPMVNTMKQSVTLLHGEAQSNLVGWQSPELGGVDTGNLRASIETSVDTPVNALEGRVFTNIPYAPFIEHNCVPHYPPWAPIRAWARTHGVDAAVVHRAIEMRGTIGKRYFGRAVEKRGAEVVGMFETTVTDIVQRYG